MKTYVTNIFNENVSTIDFVTVFEKSNDVRKLFISKER